MDNIDRARSALQALNPGCPREEWVRVLMAAKAAGIPLHDCVEWSRGGQNFKSDADCASVYRSIRPGAVSERTLYHLAHEQGWVDPIRSRRAAHKDHKTPWRTLRANPHAKAAPRPVIAPDALWSGCKPATDAHPYIVAKRGRVDGLRVVPDDSTLVVAGHPVAGWLAVPATSLAGELRTVQLIPPPGAGKKVNLPGASFVDGLFMVGELAQSTCIYIVEGIGQAWACWSATGCPSVVAFGAGRVTAVADVVRRAHPEHRIVLVLDRGKERQAEEIARYIRGEWAALPDDKPANYDANDYAAEHGADELAELLALAKAPERRFRLLAARDLAGQPPMRWLVRGVLPMQGVGAVYGASGSGKSFLALDLCSAVAGGREWFGRRVAKAPVVYVVLEGEAGFRQRVRAWEQQHGAPLPDNLRFIFQPFDLRNPDDVEQLAREVTAIMGNGALLVIDTLNRAAPGADENSSADMGAIIDGAKRLQAQLGGLTLLVHHTGKDETRGLRGHSSLMAALDAALEVRRVSGSHEWRIVKSKDDSDDLAYPFMLNVLEVGQHEDGTPMTSCAVAPDVRSPTKRPKMPTGPTQKLVYEALGSVLKASPRFGMAGAPATKCCVEIEAAMPQLAAALIATPPDKRTYVARRAVQSMAAAGVLQARDGWAWLP